MANRITLRHGSTAPSASNLLPYELGWDQNTLGLYIGQPSGEPLLISSGGGNVTGVKGSAEQSYRHGNVEITAANIGLGNVENTKLSTWSGSTNITTLGTITTGIIPWARISDVPAISIATDSGTSSITLAANTTYKITAAGSSYIFKTPPDNNTDTKVKQSGSTTASWRKILLHYTADSTSTTAVTTTTNEIYAAVGISVQPSTGTLRASVYNVSDNATIQYNSTNGCLEIIV